MPGLGAEGSTFPRHRRPRIPEACHVFSGLGLRDESRLRRLRLPWGCECISVWGATPICSWGHTCRPARGRAIEDTRALPQKRGGAAGVRWVGGDLPWPGVSGRNPGPRADNEEAQAISPGPPGLRRTVSRGRVRLQLSANKLKLLAVPDGSGQARVEAVNPCFLPQLEQVARRAPLRVDPDPRTKVS